MENSKEYLYILEKKLNKVEKLFINFLCWGGLVLIAIIFVPINLLPDKGRYINKLSINESLSFAENFGVFKCLIIISILLFILGLLFLNSGDYFKIKSDIESMENFTLTARIEEKYRKNQKYFMTIKHNEKDYEFEISTEQYLNIITSKKYDLYLSKKAKILVGIILLD